MKNKSLFSRLLENKKLMLLASFILAFVFWIISSDNITKTIVDIPLQVKLSESAEKEGLKVYSVNPELVSVDISGKRLVVDALSEDDFTATVDLFNVSKPSTESYQIDVSTKSNMSFSIEGTKTLRATVMIDKEVEKTIPVKKLLDYEPSEGYYVTDDLPSTITITGPQSIVKEVKSAYVADTVTFTENKPVVEKTLSVHLSDSEDPYDSDSKDIHSEFIKLSTDSFVNVSFESFKVKDDVPLVLKIEDENFTLPNTRYSFEPASLSVAGNEELLFGENPMEQIEFNLGSLSQYQNEVVELTMDVAELLPEGLICTNTDTVKFTLDLSFLSKKQFSTNSVSVVGLSDDNNNYEIPDEVTLTVIGTSAVLSELEPENFAVTYNFTDVTATESGSVEVPISVKINKKVIGICWVHQSSDFEIINIK